MKTRTVVALSLWVLLACDPGEPDPQNTDAGTPRECARYEEMLNGSCAKVSVLGIEERALSFTRAGYDIPGTLTLPTTQGLYVAPGVVLVHGSGPNGRDENSEGNLGYNYGRSIATFKVLAEALTHAGMAVFRYDKRTCFVENSEGLCPKTYSEYQQAHPNGVLVDDFVLDARAAL